ncbi:MAG: porin [Rhodothalassiaceae bacterium]|nr:MAG: porin [Rhodothalassiaceae bacterium]
MRCILHVGAFMLTFPTAMAQSGGEAAPFVPPIAEPAAVVMAEADIPAPEPEPQRTTEGREAAHDRDERGARWYDPIEFEVVYTGEIWGNLSGGIRRDARHLDNLDLMLTVPSETFGADGGTFFFYVLHNNKKTFSDIVGDLQVVSNIDNDRIWRIFEAWYEQNLFADRVSVKLGFMDLNAEFDAIEPAGLMILSSHGIGPDFSQTGESGPSIFPITMAGARIQLAPDERFSLRFAAFDAVAGTRNHPRRAALKFTDGEGELLVGEADLHLASGWRFVVGAWGYTARFAGIEEALGLPAERHRGNNGLYAFVHGPLYHEHGDGDQGLQGWVRFGIADGRINRLDQYIGAGLVYTGAIPGRDADRIGLAVAAARNGDSFRRFAALTGNAVEKREINVEFTWRIEAADWLALQPDFQLIINPGTDPALKNAFAAGLRVEVGFQLF